jgi:putative ABC transport system ATP-binding protein
VDSPPDNDVLWARSLVKSFGVTPALRGMTMSVRDGEAVAITGPSGSGKSTLLHCLAGITRPDSGEVWFNSGPVHSLSETARARLRRQRFGVVFQFGQLVTELTAEENVALPLMFGGSRRAAALRAARSWLDRLDVADCAQRFPGQVSGGQLQRIAVARALAHKPRILFADEPTGALDSAEGEQLMRIMLSAVRSHGMSLVLVTHNPRVAAYADREIAIQDGRIAATEVLV